MALQFKMENHRVVVDPMSLTLNCIREIWVEDVTPTKDISTKYLSFIHVISQIDPTAPYSKADPEEVVRLAKKDIFGSYDFDFSKDWVYTEEKLIEFSVAYQLAFETAEDSIVRSIDRKVHEIKHVIDTTTIEIKPSVSRGVVSYVSNFTIINKMIQEMIKITKTRDELKSSIIKETSKGKMKGERTISQLEKRRAEMKTGVVAVSDDAEEL